MQRGTMCCSISENHTIFCHKWIINAIMKQKHKHTDYTWWQNIASSIVADEFSIYYPPYLLVIASKSTTIDN